MTRYEKQLQEITIEKMAELNIILTLYGYYLTSDSKVIENYDEALAHEIEWLKEEMPEDGRYCYTCCNYCGDEKYKQAWCECKQDSVKKLDVCESHMTNQELYDFWNKK